ncbi:MAG: hypothetical protein QX198_09495, partial [Methylococcaceae bacterium]
DHALAIKTADLIPDLAKPVAVSMTAPLADLLDAKRLRVRLQVPETSALISAAKQLTLALKAQGALVYSTADEVKVVEVVISLHGDITKTDVTLSRYERRNDVINVLWILAEANSLHASELTQADQVWLAIPKLPQHLKKAAKDQRYVEPNSQLMPGLVQQLQQAVEERIGRAFHTS